MLKKGAPHTHISTNVSHVRGVRYIGLWQQQPYHDTLLAESGSQKQMNTVCCVAFFINNVIIIIIILFPYTQRIKELFFGEK